MTQHTRRTSSVVCLGLLIAAGGCSWFQGGATRAATTGPAALLTGTWVQDVAPGVTPSSLRLRSDGRFELRRKATDARPTIAGSYTVDNGRYVSFKNSSGGGLACPDAQGRYEWRIFTDRLEFALFSDGCKERAEDFTFAWVRSTSGN